MFLSPFFSDAHWAGTIFVLFFVGLLTFGAQQLATSSTPPPKADPSGFLLQSPSQEQLNALRLGLREGIELKATYTIQSTRHERAWYVGARLDGPGRIETVGVWLFTGGKPHPNLLFSVDPQARAASSWPDGRKSRLPISSVNAEALALTSALRSRT